MKNLASLIIVLLAGIMAAGPYQALAQGAAKPLKEVMKLKINGEGGANGGNIAWHPVQKKYYAAMAGNISYPLNVFSAKGIRLSDSGLATMFDVRGLWYNPTTKTLQTNGYGDNGWAEYELNPRGIPSDVHKIEVVSLIPDVQCTGAYDAKNNQVYFFGHEAASVTRHGFKPGSNDTLIPLALQSMKDPDVPGSTIEELKLNYNVNAMIFTGITNSELGILNAGDKKIELYSAKTGLMTKVLKLPDNAPAEYSLNFSYSNGIYWLFSKTERVWYGYK